MHKPFFLSFFSLSFSFFLFYVCTTHILTLRINVQKNDEYVTTAFVWLLLARFFSSSSIYIFLSCCVVVLAWLISFVVEEREREKNCSLLFRLAMLLLTEWKCYKQRERERKRRKKKKKKKRMSQTKRMEMFVERSVRWWIKIKNKGCGEWPGVVSWMWAW
jgi:hypothetical protein